MVVLARPRSAYVPKGSTTKRRAKTAPRKTKSPTLDRVYVEACRAAGGAAPEEGIVCGLARCGELRAHVEPGDLGARKLAQLSAFASDDATASKLKAAALSFPRRAAAEAGSTLKERRVVARLFRAVTLELSGSLVTLELSGSPRGFGSGSVAALAKGLGGKGSPLRHFVLSHCPLSPAPALELCRALAASRVNTLALRSCGLDDRSASAVAAVCRAHGARRDEAVWAKNLRKNLAYTFPYAGAGVGGGARIATGAPRSFPRDPSYFDHVPVEAREQGLLCLDVSDNAFGDGLAEELGAALAGDDYLLGCNMSGNGKISDAGAAALKKALFYDRVLTRHENMTKTDGAMLSLRLEDCAAFGKASETFVSQKLDARLAAREAAGYFARGQGTRAAQALLALWRADARTPPPTELALSNASSQTEKAGGAVELFCRRLAAQAPTGRVRSCEELDACLRAVRVDVDGWRSARAVAAALRRALRDLEADGLGLDAWVAAAAAADGDVSRVELRKRLGMALFSPEDATARGASALLDAAMRRLDDLADGQKNLQPKEFLEKATARRPPKVYAAAVAEAAATEPRPADRARQDGVGAVLDALDGFMAARGRRCRHLFHDLAAHATETAGLHAAEGLRVSDARDALEAWIASGALAFARDESKLLEAAGARDAGDERAFLKSDRARRGLGGAKFVEARPAPAPADAALDFAGYAAQLAFDDGAPGLDPLALERALLAARTKGEAAAGDARGALALRGACARLAAFDEDPERWVAGLCDGGVLMKRHLAGGLARLAGGDGAEDAAAALGAARADAVFKFADADSDALAAGEALGALAAALGERGAAVLRIAHHGSTAGEILDFARARRWTAAEVARQGSTRERNSQLQRLRSRLFSARFG